MRGLLYVIVMIIVTGCNFSSSQPKVLDEAQCLMQNNPSEALSKLNGIDVCELPDSATLARWALLYSEAIVANNLSAPTDTIVNIAIDYYGGHNMKDEYQKALRLKSLIKSFDNVDALASARYLQKEKEFMLYQERLKHQQQMFIVIIVLLAATGIIVWMRQKMKLQSLQNDALLSEVSNFKSQIDATHGDVDRLKSKLHGLLENRFILIDSLCQTYYEAQGTKSERNAIVEKVKGEIKSLRTESFAQMEQAVNDCRDNLLVVVKRNYPEIKAEEYQLLVYLACGLSTRTLSLLIGESVDVIYKRKSRLKSRVKERVAPYYPSVMDAF